MMKPLVDEREMLLLAVCRKDELLASEPSVVTIAPLFASVNERFTEASNVMSAIVRDRLTVLVEPVPEFVNSTESPFAGVVPLNQFALVPQGAVPILPAQVKTAAAASPDKLLHANIALATHRQVEEILTVIFMLNTAACEG